MPRTSCHGNSLISCMKSISADTVNQGSQVHPGDWEKRADETRERACWDHRRTGLGRDV